MNLHFLPVIALLALACSSSTEDPQTPAANLCATPGSTYLSSLTLQSGNCPDNIPDAIVNIPSDGSLPQAKGTTCQSEEQDGCTGRGTNCVYVSGGCKNIYTFSTTFTDDGASADGLISSTITCDDGSGCTGTYRSHYERQ